MTYPRADVKALGSCIAIVMLCALQGVAWLGFGVVVAVIVVRRLTRHRPQPTEPIQAQVLGGPLDGLEFELHV